MEKIRDIINYLFGVSIIDRSDVLVIEDRRPPLSMFYSGLGVVAVAGIAIWGWFGNMLKPDMLSLLMIVAPLAAAAYFGVTGTFRQRYVFDKTRDTWEFTSQSVIREDVLEGSLSQFRAVQLQRRENDESKTYAVALLLQGMLLGRSDTQILREKPPVFNSFAAEKRIGTAISRFLSIKFEGVVDVS